MVKRVNPAREQDTGETTSRYAVTHHASSCRHVAGGRRYASRLAPSVCSSFINVDHDEFISTRSPTDVTSQPSPSLSGCVCCSSTVGKVRQSCNASITSLQDVTPGYQISLFIILLASGGSHTIRHAPHAGENADWKQRRRVETVLAE